MKILKCLMVFFIFLLISACEGGGGGSDIASSNPLAIKSIPTHEKAPSLEGFDFTFKTGDFWEYQWEETERKTSSTSYGTSPSFSEKTGVIKISLGEPMKIMGVVFYKIKIEYSGDAKESDASVTWQYIASHSNVLYGYKNTEGRSGNGIYKIFDAQNRSWQGGTLMGGVFGAGLENESAPTLSAAGFEYGVYRVLYPKSSLLSAIGVYHYSAEETFKQGVGLIEKSYSTSSRNTFSGITFTRSTKSSWKLIHSSFGI